MRYIHILFKIFLSLSVIVVPVLAPLNFLGGSHPAQGVDGLDKLSWANVDPDHARFFWVHLFMTLFVVWYVCYIVYKELLFFVEVRNCFLASPDHQTLDSAATVLATDTPQQSLHTLKDVYSMFPGGVRSIKLNRDVSVLSKKLQRRERLICAYEAAVIKTMRSAILYHGKYAGTRSSTRKTFVEEKVSRDAVLLNGNRMGSIGQRWSFKFPALLTLTKEKADHKDQCLQELARLNEEIRSDRQKLTSLYRTGEVSKEFPHVRSAFVRFNKQSSAWMACQTVLCPRPLQLMARHVDIALRRYQMGFPVFSLVESLFTDWSGLSCHRVASCPLGSTCCLYRIPFPDHYSGGLNTVAFLASHNPPVAY